MAHFRDSYYLTKSMFVAHTGGGGFVSLISFYICCFSCTEAEQDPVIAV